MITAEQLKKANEQLQTLSIKGKEYVQVTERVMAFRTLFPNGSITTEIVDHNVDIKLIIELSCILAKLMMNTCSPQDVLITFFQQRCFFELVPQSTMEPEKDFFVSRFRHNASVYYLVGDMLPGQPLPIIPIATIDNGYAAAFIFLANFHRWQQLLLFDECCQIMIFQRDNVVNIRLLEYVFASIVSPMPNGWQNGKIVFEQKQLPNPHLSRIDL